uniref:Hexosyltransferase n=1 Tax=Apteryx owenii TaxID=8824 RepID=A0A8B9PFV3_APTOW
MGGPGMIFSREVLRRMVPHIGECLQEMYTTHEDVEVGRCVRRFGGTQCVWSYEVSRDSSQRDVCLQALASSGDKTLPSGCNLMVSLKQHQYGLLPKSGCSFRCCPVVGRFGHPCGELEQGREPLESWT